MTLGKLKERLQDLTFGDVGEDLYGYLQKFFSLQDTKERMLYLNQRQNYEQQVWRDGTPKPVYSKNTVQKRVNYGFYIPSSFQYTAHETGGLFRSMGLLVTSEYVAIVCTSDTAIAEGLDFFEEGQVWAIEDDDYINEYFSLYDPEGNTLGLTDENLESLKGDMIDSVIKQLKEYLNG